MSGSDVLREAIAEVSGIITDIEAKITSLETNKKRLQRDHMDHTEALGATGRSNILERKISKIQTQIDSNETKIREEREVLDLYRAERSNLEAGLARLST